MMKGLANRIKKHLFGDTDSLHKAMSAYKMYKAQVADLHGHYTNVIEPMEDNEIKKGFEDAHFADLYECHCEKENIMSNLSLQVNARLESLQKGKNEFQYTDKMKHSLGYARKDMPQVDADNVTDFVLHFNDKVGVKKVKRKLSSLKPSQSEMNDDKVYHFVGQGIDGKNTKNKYIISNDNYILDGHHRWAADLELSNDEDEVSCYKINLPAKELIKQANKLKMTKNVDIDDDTLKKALITIALAKAQGFLSEDLVNLVKGSHTGLIPVNRTVIKNGRTYNQIFWVAPNQVNEKRNSRVRTEELPQNRIQALDKQEILDRNSGKNAERFKTQQEDDSITNKGDIVNINYIGRSSGEHFNFEGLKVARVDENNIYVIMNKDITSKKKYSDGSKIVFRKGAVLKVPKHNNEIWGNDFNYQLQIDPATRKDRLDKLNFLERIVDYSRDARSKGYDVYADVATMNEEQVRAKYAPFFAKYGNDFDPVKMFDNATEHIKSHWGNQEVNIKCSFTTTGFNINVNDKLTGENLMSTTRQFTDGERNLPPDHNKGVYHAYFAIHRRKDQGGGLAKKLFCEYYDQYKKMGLDHMAVGPGLSSGPYVWPSYAFYAPVGHARSVLGNFQAGKSREITPYYPDTRDANVESLRKDGSRILIKYKDSENEIDVTNEKGYMPEQQAKVDALNLEFEDLQMQGMNISGRALPDYEGEDKLTEQEAESLLEPLRAQMNSKEGEINRVPKVNKYEARQDGVVDITKTVSHTITQAEADEAARLFNEWSARNPNAVNFPSTIWTKSAILKQASKVAYLATGGGGSHHVVDMKNAVHAADFENSIGYKQYIKERDGAK